jgi:hypothetical protein
MAARRDYNTGCGLLPPRFLCCKAVKPLVKSEVRIINRVLIFLLDIMFGY